MASVAEASSAPLSFREVSGHSLVYGIIGERAFVFDSECPHKGGPLAQGELLGQKIKCPWHGYEFNVFSGKVASIPYPLWYDEWRKTGSLHVYKTKIRNSVIYFEE